jgi:tRNA(Ile2)-agmatinylcytidine synthase
MVGQSQDQDGRTRHSRDCRAQGKRDPYTLQKTTRPHKCQIHLGIDDTDSPGGMCTTYLGAILIRHLGQAGVSVTSARLIRLNPNVPWKTRGNAAIGIMADGDLQVAFETATSLVDRYAELDKEGTHPGVVVSENRPDERFYLKALRDFCDIGEAREVLDEAGARYRGYKLGRGLIGAAAAIAASLPDETTELLAYRREELFGTPRSVDPESFFLAERATTPHTWDTVDTGNRCVVCVPHTPDPVLFGIRGESPYHVARAAGFLKTEPFGLFQVYQTNQGTDAHLEQEPGGHLVEGHSYSISGTVVSVPMTEKGGRVSFLLYTANNTLPCIAFEPTKQFRHVVRGLCPGDLVTTTGSFKEGCLNLEKLEIRFLERQVRRESPFCPSCGSRMTSAGKDKGFKCRHCGSRLSEPLTREIPRTISEGWFEVPPCARRHLARPLIRERW